MKNEGSWSSHKGKKATSELILMEKFKKYTLQWEGGAEEIERFEGPGDLADNLDSVPWHQNGDSRPL